MAGQQKNGISLIAWGLLLLLGLVWGGSFFFVRIAVFSIPPLTLVFIRLSVAAIALHLYLHGKYGLYGLLRKRWRSFLLLGLINNALPHSLLFTSQIHLGAGLASILNATTPVWTILIAHVMTGDEKITLAKLAGAALGIAGAAILIAPGLSIDSALPLWALVLPVLAAISYGFAAIFGTTFRSVPAPAIAAGQLTASSIVMLPVSLMVDQSWTLQMPSAKVVLAVLGLALVATAFAYVLYFRIIELAGATNVSLVTLLVPASAILLGTIFLGERLGVGEIVGFSLIATGLLVIDGRLKVLFFRSAQTDTN